MRHAVARACLCTCLKHLRRAKKSTPCLRKLPGVQQIACLKVHFPSHSVKHKDLTRKECVFICYFIDSVVKVVLPEAATGGVLCKKVFLKFAKFTGKHLCQSLFFNKFAGTADVFTYRLNLTIFEHSLHKVNEIF